MSVGKCDLQSGLLQRLQRINSLPWTVIFYGRELQLQHLKTNIIVFHAVEGNEIK